MAEIQWGIQVCRDLSALGPVMLQLYHQLRSRQLWQLYTQLEMPVCGLLAAMDLRGVLVDRRALIQAAELLKVQVTTYGSRLSLGRMFITSLRFNSHVQILGI